MSCIIIILCSLTFFAFINGCSKPVSSMPLKITIPEEWKSSISIGDLIIDCNAFYNAPWEFGLFPVVRVYLPVENLTTKTLYLKINYRTESIIKGYGNSGMGVCYTLGPEQKRLIDAIVPIASATRPIRFLSRMYEPRYDFDESTTSQTAIFKIDPFIIKNPQSNVTNLKKVKNAFFEVNEINLSHTQSLGNLVNFQVKNLTNQDLTLGYNISVNDPENLETKSVLSRPRGFFIYQTETIPANGLKNISAPYDIPVVCPEPVLSFMIFKPNVDVTNSNKHDSRRRDVILAGYGSFNLNQASEQKICVIPVYPSTEERANLTMQKESKHFLFRYRPDSYAEKNIDKAINDREEAYQKLSEVLKMELPEIVTIDLYPDMEAKGLGSGTTWTPANTRNNKHICELYNEGYQIDPYHELAHIFSFHFPGFNSSKGGIVEAFAAYFETNNMSVGPTKQLLKERLNEGKLPSLIEVLQSENSGEELAILIDFLLNKDVEKFKKFYVLVTQSQKKASIEQTIRQVYEIETKELEKQWHEYINQDNNI